MASGSDKATVWNLTLVFLRNKVDKGDPEEPRAEILQRLCRRLGVCVCVCVCAALFKVAKVPSVTNLKAEI